MPTACPWDRYARRYPRRPPRHLPNAHGLPVGLLRSPLPPPPTPPSPECPPLARGIVTLRAGAGRGLSTERESPPDKPEASGPAGAPGWSRLFPGRCLQRSPLFLNDLSVRAAVDAFHGTLADHGRRLLVVDQEGHARPRTGCPRLVRGRFTLLATAARARPQTGCPRLVRGRFTLGACNLPGASVERNDPTGKPWAFGRRRGGPRA